LLLLLLLLALKIVQRRGLRASRGKDSAISQRWYVADIYARRGDGGRGMRGGIQNYTTLQHIATIRLVLGLMVARWWTARGRRV